MTQLRTVSLVLITLSIFVLNCYARITRRQTSNDKILLLPGLDVCGVQGFSFGIKVIGGFPAELNEYPWMALLGYTTGNQRQVSWRCGGTLITDKFVVTAAHCVIFSPSQQSRGKITLTTVRLGELDRNPDAADGAEPKDFEVDRIIPHAQYDDVRKLNDICLVRLKERVQFSKTMSPICLPPAELYQNDYVGKKAIIAGWGRARLDANGNAYSDATDTKLNKAEIDIQDTELCKSNYTKVNSRLVLDKRVVCAGSPGIDTCQGDSGGPLMFETKVRGTPEGVKANHFLMGVVSYGIGCAKEGYPGIYTRVSEQMNWIVSNID